MTCLNETAALLVLLLSCATAILAGATNVALADVVQQMDNIGIDSRRYRDLKVKWRWILVMALGNMAVWGAVGGLIV